MSFSFYIAAPTPPDYQMVLDGLDYWDVHCEEGDREEEGPWTEGTLHFYRDEYSTRGVEVSFENAQFQVRILTLASPDDHEMALRFVESLAVLLKQPVTPEDGEPFPVDQLRQRYDSKWSRSMNDHGASVLRKMIEESEQTVTLSGPHRTCHIGLRVLDELLEGGPEEEFTDRLLGKMLDVQNVDADEYYLANAMHAKKSDSDAGSGFSFAVWGPGVNYLLPEVEYVAIVRGEDEPPLFIRFENLRRVLPKEGWFYLDETQLLIDALEADEWEEVLRRGAPFEDSPFEEGK